jgi:hypothetical protein
MRFDGTNVPAGCRELGWKLLHRFGQNNVGQKTIDGTFRMTKRWEYLRDALMTIFHVDAREVLEGFGKSSCRADSYFVLNIGLIRLLEMCKRVKEVLII